MKPKKKKKERKERKWIKNWIKPLRILVSVIYIF